MQQIKITNFPIVMFEEDYSYSEIVGPKTMVDNYVKWNTA